MVISSRVGSILGRWSALDAIPEVEDVKHQSGSGWIRNWCHFKVDFEFLSWISKSFRNDPSTLYSCFQITITSLFQLRFAHRLKRWIPDFPSFKTIYSMYTMDSIKCSKFVLKVKVYNAIKFLSSKFPCSWILLHTSFSMFSCFLSYSIMVIYHLPNSWYPHLTFPFGSWVLTHLFHHLAIFWSFKI